MTRSFKRKRKNSVSAARPRITSLHNSLIRPDASFVQMTIVTFARRDDEIGFHFKWQRQFSLPRRSASFVKIYPLVSRMAPYGPRPAEKCKFKSVTISMCVLFIRWLRENSERIFCRIGRIGQQQISFFSRYMYRSRIMSSERCNMSCLSAKKSGSEFVFLARACVASAYAGA
jgi:hypothetical protein